MSTLVTPIYTGTLNAQPLRFFKAPLAGPHLVWHSVDDLHRCLNLPRGLRRHFKQSLQKDYADAVTTVATEAGITTIAPHWMAQGLIGSAIELKLVPARLEMDYAREATRAWNAGTGDLPPRAGLDLMIAAFRNTNGLDSAS